MSTLSEQADAAYKQTILAASQNSEKSNAGVVDMDLPTPATQPVPAEPEDPNVTTEDDLISAIKRWVKSGHDDGASGAVTIRDSAQSIVDGLHEVLKEYPPRQPISDVRLKELVALHAPEIGRKPEPKIPTASNQKPATSKLTDLEWEHPDWRVAFKSVNQLQSGGIRMLIKNFLPEGTNLITGYAGDGKSWLGLSITKALTTGQPLFGIPEFEVVGITPVLYLTPEQNGAAFRQRCETLQITNDERLFLCRTCSEGSKLPLVDSKLEAAIRYLRPVVILDTVIRFTESDDENSATQNQKLVDDIIHLRNVGARTVIGVHHSRKDLKEGEPTLEAAVRGSGDLAAMTDGVWAVIRNDRLYKNGAGPNQISVIPVKPVISLPGRSSWRSRMWVLPVRLALAVPA